MKQSKLNKKIILRKATLYDLTDILRWRNDPVTIKMSLDSRRIPTQEHTEWFISKLNDPNRIFLIGYYEGEKFGVIRYILEDDGTYEVSINIAPERRGQGLGVRLLKESLSSVKGKVIAKIKPINKASIAAFQKAGYLLKEKNKEVVIMEINV